MGVEKKKFVVFKANIKDDDGVKRKDGEVVELSSELAKRYNKLGFLRPYIEDDENDGDSELERQEAPQLARSNRVATKPSAA